MTTVELVCDTRERAIQDNIDAEFLNPNIFAKTKGTIKCSVRQVTVGDYAILVNDELVAIFERKTLKDYGASFKDARLANKAKLLNARNMSGCKIYYIIEGPLNPDYDSEHAGIKYKNILASIHDLMIYDGIYIIRTANGQHTAKELRMLCESFIRVQQKKDKETVTVEFSGDTTAVQGDQVVQSEDTSAAVVARATVTFDEILNKANFTPEEKLIKCRVNAWMQVPGIGLTVAPTVASQFKLGDWITGSLEMMDVTGFEHNGRKNKRVSTALSVKPTTAMQVKLLSEMSGFTLKSAEELVTQYSLEDLLTDKPYTDVRLGAKQTKLTKARVEKIKMFLTNTN